MGENGKRPSRPGREELKKKRSRRNKIVFAVEALVVIAVCAAGAYALQKRGTSGTAGSGETQKVTESIAETAEETKLQTESEAVTETAAETESEIVTETAAETESETVTEAASEAESETAAETASEAAGETAEQQSETAVPAQTETSADSSAGGAAAGNTQVLDTPIGELSMPESWDDSIQVKDTSAGDQYARSFYSTVSGSEVLLFEIVIGGESTGYQLGSAPDENGTQQAIWLNIGEIQTDASWTDEITTQVNTEQSGVNDLIEQIYALDGFAEAG